MAIKSLQLRIQDFPLGALIRWGEGASPSDTGIFGENLCQNERVGSRWGRGGAGFTNALIFKIGLKIQ